MVRVTFCLWLLSCCVLVCSASKPNVVFILADDMGQWAAGTYGNSEIHTPNIDTLAKEGLKFNNAFANTPVCSASRTSYFTSRIPSQHGVHDWISGGNGCDGKEGIRYTENEVFYTDVLKDNGYTCGISGKIHIGDQQKAQHSFDHWFVHQSGGASYNDPPMVQNETCIHFKGYVTDIITDDAIQFINKHHMTNQSPFYLSVHYTSPHSPYTGPEGKANTMHPPEIVALYDNCSFSMCPQESRNPFSRPRDSLTHQCLGNRECLKGYYAAVTAMDLNIGRILKTLKDLNLDDSTLIVFASDHGFNAGHHGLWGKGNAAYPLNMFETSIRIPLIFRHTGKIQPGVEQSVVQVIDVAPTLLDYVGNLSYPETSIIAGESFKKLLNDPKKRNSLANRTIFGEYGQTRYGRFNGTMKYVMRQTGFTELYDLSNDKNETRNLLLPFTNEQRQVANQVTMYDYATIMWFSYFENPYLSGWTEPVTGRGQLRSIVFNRDGWPNTPAFDIHNKHDF